MPQWEGKSRGNKLGYRIFVAVCKNLGIAPAYLLLRFVAFYFLFFAGESSKHIYRYFRRRCGYGRVRSALRVYTNYYRFGQTILDRIVVMSGLENKFTFHFDGEENLIDIVNHKQGGILLSAHMGNWEVAGHFLHRLDTVFHVVMFDGEHEKIRNYLETSVGKRKFNVIVVRDDFSHVYEIGEALQKNELVCMHADRYTDRAKTIECDFLGEAAMFPAGPFALATTFGVPVSIVFAFKETSTHYHFFGSRPIMRNPTETKKEYGLRLRQMFIAEMEKKITLYPDQWFNYYDFWMKDAG